MVIGEIVELWRYCVSSIGGEAMAEVGLSVTGIPGDRQFCLFDPATGKPAAPEKEPRWRPALFLIARRQGDGLPEIGFPDGAWLHLDNHKLDDRLLQHFGFPARIGTYAPGTWPQANFPRVQNRYQPSPLHLVATGSLDQLAELSGVTDVDSRRFRPSVLVRTSGGRGFRENDWIGHTIGLGDVRVRIAEGTKRCGMTLISQPGLSERPAVLRTILHHNGRNLGVYGATEHSGSIRLGDPVRLYR